MPHLGVLRASLGTVGAQSGRPSCFSTCLRSHSAPKKGMNLQTDANDLRDWALAGCPFSMRWIVRELSPGRLVKLGPALQFAQQQTQLSFQFLEHQS